MYSMAYMPGELQSRQGYNCFREVSHQFGVGKSTIVGIVAEVCVAMDLELLSTTVCLGPTGR
ncbi:UNVERIFIED_CONTAM: hypothetical protein K2H54_046152, partial [Gekko kuhli]